MSDQDYTARDVKRYMRHRLEEVDRNALFEFEFQIECREVLDELEIDPQSGTGLLFSFATIAGGWKTKVGRRLVSHEAECLGLNDDFELIAKSDLTLVNEAGYGRHSHRNRNGATPADALLDLHNLTIDGDPMKSMHDTFDRLGQDPEPFDRAMDTFKRIRSFGSLTAFDFLDTAARVNGRTEIVPLRLDVKHVDRNGPRVTLRRTLSNEYGSEIEVQSEEGQQFLDELIAYAERDLGLSHADALFDVESCLCTYHSDLENKGPDWRGTCA